MIDRPDSLPFPTKRAPFGRRLKQAACALFLLVASHSALESPALADGVVQVDNPVAAFQAREAQLFAIGYRLATTNAPFCERKAITRGVLVHDARAYSASKIVRDALGLSGDIGVQAVAVGSPADAAGLRQNDTLLSIDGSLIDQMPWAEERKWERATVINAELASPQALDLQWRGSAGKVSTATILPTIACASAFELVSGNDKAIADGSRVLIGADFPGFAYPEDEFAAAIAHEMAHNLLGHLDYLEAVGRKRSLVRLSERDADRLMPWLLANTGYDPQAAVRFMQRYGPRHGGGLFRKRTHDGWDERVEFIKDEVGRLERMQSPEGGEVFDWSTKFDRMLDTTRLED